VLLVLAVAGGASAAFASSSVLLDDKVAILWVSVSAFSSCFKGKKICKTPQMNVIIMNNFLKFDSCKTPKVGS
jgi:hypothetical protein